MPFPRVVCPRRDSSTKWRRVLVAAVLILFAGHFQVAVAQGLTSAFGGFATKPDEPIDIQAKRLDVDDRARQAVFSGNVLAVQGTFTMNSTTLEVHYATREGVKKSSAGSTGLGGGSTEIIRLVARGKVFIKSAKKNAQTASGNWAEFDVRTRIITMGDLVTLKQGKNVIRGTRLVINLNTGRSSVLSSTASSTTNTGGRIRMVITPDREMRSGFGKKSGKTGKKRNSDYGTTQVSQPAWTSRGEQ